MHLEPSWQWPKPVRGNVPVLIGGAAGPKLFDAICDYAESICAIADVFDALTSERPYKKAWPVQEAVDFLLKQRGAHFDPRLVDLLGEAPIAQLRHDDGAEFAWDAKAWVGRDTGGMPVLRVSR